ncbi:MAG: F-type H+-transporting ATPase subunit b [Thermodesulfobacteriota bacterium]|nr:F-type H+-transporting ATPase subunit b [Thermodesulfobacteriota bacterium]
MKTNRILTLLITVAGSAITSAAYAAGGGEGASPWDAWMLSWRVINTVALIALLVYLLKKPLADFFAERRNKIGRDLEEAREQRDKAERTIEEYKQKLAGMEAELEKMRVELKKSAEAEKDKVLGNAERMSNAMVESARIAAEQELRNAKITLKNEAVDMAVQLAEALIREKINEDDRKRIVEDYLVKVGGMK